LGEEKLVTAPFCPIRQGGKRSYTYKMTISEQIPSPLTAGSALTKAPARGTALVTGGAKRLGKVIALALARDGWDIALHYGQSATEATQTQQEILALGRRCQALQADLSLATQVQHLFEQALARLGNVGVVVNCASHFEQDRPETVSAESLSAHFLPNLTAPLLLARALYEHRRRAAAPGTPAAVVINLLDQKLWNLNPDFFSYTLTKAALHSATSVLAQALAPHVRVVGVAPGLTMISHLQTAEDFARTQAISPLGRSSQPEDIAATVLFAVNNQAITGSSIVVDGGQHLMPMTRDFSFL
jgi:NAD(P)-dependent dehydrogenase (short-subunit alcohol dehydrogenase family)